MKLAIRVFALFVVLAGLFATTLSAPTAVSAASKNPTPETLPIPLCGPWVACTGKVVPSNLR